MWYHRTVQVEISVVQFRRGILKDCVLWRADQYMRLRLFQELVKSITDFGFQVTGQENGMLIVTKMLKKEWMHELTMHYCCLILKMKEMMYTQEFLFANKTFYRSSGWRELNVFLFPKWYIFGYLYNPLRHFPRIRRSVLGSDALSGTNQQGVGQRCELHCTRCGALEAYSVAIAKQWKEIGV